MPETAKWRLWLAMLTTVTVMAGDRIPAGVWDVYGGAGANVGRSDNPGFVGASNPNHDPNNPVCALPPNDPAYDPSICEPGGRGSRRSATTGSLSLTGGLSATWPLSRFDVSYSPSARFFFERSELNQVSHDLSSTWRHDYSPRASLNLSERLNYTPEQDLDPNGAQQNNVLVTRTRRTTSNFRGTFAFQKSDRTSLTWNYSYLDRSFSAEDFVDTGAHSAGFSWRRALTRRHAITSAYNYGVFSFKGRFEGSQTHGASVGYAFRSSAGFTISVAAGQNVLLPDDPAFDSTRGSTLTGSVGWTGQRLGLTAGYSKGITDGGGAFPNSETQSAYGNVRVAITPALSADVATTLNVHDRTGGGPTAPRTDEAVRTLSARTGLQYTINPSWAITGGYAYNRQSQTGFGTRVPDLRTNNYNVGVSWSFN